MQVRKIYCFRSFALDSAHVKFDVWNGPNKLTSSVFFFFDGSSDIIFVLICTGSSSHFPIHEVKRPVLQLCSTSPAHSKLLISIKFQGS